MAKFTEKKIKCQKLEKIKTADGKISGGYESQLRVSINGMLNDGIQNDGQLNGRVQEYEASFTVKNNKIFGLKTVSVKIPTSTGMESTDEYTRRERSMQYVFFDYGP